MPEKGQPEGGYFWTRYNRKAQKLSTPPNFAEAAALRAELLLVLDALDEASWREDDWGRVKRICFAPTAIERIRALLAR